jgi:hypothetical protein
MSDVFGVFTRNTGADMEFVDKTSGVVQFAFRNSVGNQTVVSSTDLLTAHAGGGQTSALQLAAAINRITTVATGNDSVKLPISVAGLDVVVINAASANSLNVFGQTGDIINALSANTAFAVAAGKTCTFYCCTAGQWHSILSA